MNGNEPLTLYVAPQSGVASFSWRPEGLDATHFLAVPSAGESALRKTLEQPGDRKSAVAELLGRTGGLWAIIERDQQRLRLSLRHWTGTRYQPPSRVVVLEPDTGFREAAVPGPGASVPIEPGQHALLAADSISDEQLRVWLTGLSGLPADLRAATLGSMLISGIWTSQAPAAARGLPWWVTLVAALLMAALGTVAGFLISLRKPPAPPDLVSAPIAKVEAAMAKSADPALRELVENHTGPFAARSAGLREAEAWMLARLVLMAQGKPALTAFTRAANQQTLADYRAAQATRPRPMGQAVLATACSASAPPPIVHPAACKQVDPKLAEAGFADLEKFAASRPAPPPPAPEQPKEGGH